MKTHKALAKRFKISKTGKLIKKTAGQDHFNSRECGNTGRNKRRDQQLNNKKLVNNIKALIQ